MVRVGPIEWARPAQPGRSAVLEVGATGSYRVLASYLNLFGASDPIDGSQNPSAPVLEAEIRLRPGIEVEGSAPPGTKAIRVRFEGHELDADESKRLRGASPGGNGTYRIRGVPAAGRVEIVTDTGQLLQTLVDGEAQ